MEKMDEPVPTQYKRCVWLVEASKIIKVGRYTYIQLLTDSEF